MTTQVRKNHRSLSCSAFGLVLGLCLLALSGQAIPFELTPVMTKQERRIAFNSAKLKFRNSYKAVSVALHAFSNPVHEGITNMAYGGCQDGNLAQCANVDALNLSPGIVAGVRWNDDPPFQFAEGEGKYPACRSRPPRSTISISLATECWLEHFLDVEKLAGKNHQEYMNGGGTLLARTHFGDLQFLHSMATTTGLRPEVTKQKILMWAEFMWRAQSGNEDRIRTEIKMGAVPVVGLLEHFPKSEERTVSELFTMGRPWLRSHAKDLMLGSLFHMVQDSFSTAHVVRTSDGSESSLCTVPAVVEFHSYPGQAKGVHKHEDSLMSAVDGLTGRGSNVTDVMKHLVEFHEADVPWSDVHEYLNNCVYRLSGDAQKSTNGI